MMTVAAFNFTPGMVLSGQLLLLWGIVDLLFFCAAAMWAAQTILFYRWERKHGMTIASDSFWGTKILVFPKVDKVHDVDER
jgi:hypothetical protein